MGTTYSCTCPTTGAITYCSCGCNTCGDPCQNCPTWYWWVVGFGLLIAIVIGIIAAIVRRRNRVRRNQALEITLNTPVVQYQQPLNPYQTNPQSGPYQNQPQNQRQFQNQPQQYQKQQQFQPNKQRTK